MAGPKTRVETAEQEAAEWHMRLGERRVSTETLEAFFAWRAVPENDDAYRRVETVWAASGALAGDAAIAAAVAEAMDRRRSGRTRFGSPRTVFGAAAAVTAAVVLGLAGWGWWSGRGVVSTAVGEQRVVQLADGSEVRLDTGSAIRVRFSEGQRRIELERGQALFEVAHDASRPFVVSAGETEVTAVGTVFDVRRVDGGARVTLVSGVVDVVREPTAAPARMRAGQQVEATRSGVRTRAVDVTTATSWAEGRIVFEDEPLASAVAEVNRYLTAPIVLEAGALADTPVNGVFRTGDREAFAASAADGLGLRTSVRPDGSLLLSRRTNN
ncbi:MAG: FecR domain-containing protein [Brevundimonas sp.]|nr:FecR domain-containing protein [Brevundimonas sp.]